MPMRGFDEDPGSDRSPDDHQPEGVGVPLRCPLRHPAYPRCTRHREWNRQETLHRHDNAWIDARITQHVVDMRRRVGPEDGSHLCGICQRIEIESVSEKSRVCLVDHTDEAVGKQRGCFARHSATRRGDGQIATKKVNGRDEGVGGQGIELDTGGGRVVCKQCVQRTHQLGQRIVGRRYEERARTCLRVEGGENFKSSLHLGDAVGDNRDQSPGTRRQQEFASLSIEQPIIQQHSQLSQRGAQRWLGHAQVFARSGKVPFH